MNGFMENWGKGASEPPHEILLPITFSSNEDPGEHTQMRRLDRAFAARINKVWMSMKTAWICQYGRLKQALWHI